MTPPQSPSQIDGTFNFAETDPPMTTVFQPFGDGVCQSGERIGVSQVRVIHCAEDQLSDWLEIVELENEFFGNTAVAQHAARARRNLQARREGEKA